MLMAHREEVKGFVGGLVRSLGVIGGGVGGRSGVRGGGGGDGREGGGALAAVGL